MKVGDLVKRRSTGKVDIVVEIVLGLRPSIATNRVRLAGNHQQLVYASNYEVVSESR
jgi:hypothetical protein